MFSGIAGAILAPILPQFVLNKLFDSLFEHLSRDQHQPSSSSHVDKLQQLENERKAFAEANLKLQILQSEVRRLHKRDKQNMRLIPINNKLRDVSYQIKDLKDDLEYMELQRKVEEINLQDEAADKNPSTAQQLLSSITPWKAGGSSDKRRRLSSSESTDDIVNKMRAIVNQIDCIDSEMMRFANQGGYNSCGQHQVAENKRVTTSSPSDSKIYGRDNEQSRLIQVLLEEPNASGIVSVVPVVGMGGIGKTTLAQFVFNSAEIATHFEKKAWVCVSDYFNRLGITKEILDSLCIGEGSSSTVTISCDVLEREIKRLVTGKKFLLVLDDVWSDKWRELLNFLLCAQAKAIKLIVTCRDPKVLGGLANGNNQITLKGLSDEDNWSLLVKCAFADKNSDNSPELHAIGKQIVGKLKGSPLAAKTVGRLLGSCLTEEYWKDILESDLWKLKTDEQGIMSALALSYYHLCQPLQLCFAFCSVFPKDFRYDMDSVIGMWIAHGYIQEIEGSSKTLEDIGEEYWLELEGRGFFEIWFDKVFKMHDLLHDLARSVSHGETYIYEGRKDEEIPKDVCHLCVHSFCDLELVCKTNNLRTLILYKASDMHAILSHKAFKRIRVLVIFDTNVQELPDNISHLKHLQYLDVEATNIKFIPESLCMLYLLRVLILGCPPPTLPSRFHNLINLRRFYLHYDDNLMYHLQDLEDYHDDDDLEDYLDYSVTYLINSGGYQIAQLRNMNELRGKLLIRGLENIIGNMEEMMKAKYLKEKRHIKVLSLIWKNTSDDDCKHDLQEQTLEALEPHHNLKYLGIVGYMGFKSPNWLVTSEFQRLKEIKLQGCRKWKRLPAALGLLPSLKSLKLFGMENITIEVDYSVTEMYPSLQSLKLIESTLSFEGMSSSSSSSSSSSTTGQNHNHFPKLTSLTIKESEVNGLHLSLFSVLKSLNIINSRGLDDQLAECLNGVSSLSDLDLDGAKIQIFPAKVMATLHALVKLNISNCDELISWGTEEEMTEDGLPLPNLQCLRIASCKDLETLPAWLPRHPLLEELIISDCPKFISWGTEEEEITEHELPLPNLQYMEIFFCLDLETLPAWLPRLPSLNELIIKACPKIHSLPQDNLPSSLEKLYLIGCERSLTERCQQEGSVEWQKIQHIPHRLCTYY